MSSRTKHIAENLVLLRRSLIYQTKEFFNNSTLHGVRYIADSSRPFGEKFMWFAFTSIGAVSALVIIMSLWEKFQTNPTITGLDTDFHNQQIIFPTVVVCPTDPYNETLVKDVSYKELAVYDEADAPQFHAFLRTLSKLSYNNLAEAYELSLNFSQSGASTVEKLSLRHLAFEVKMDCKNLLHSCRYRDEDVNCDAHFDTIYTERGFCFAFNTKFKSFENKDERSVEFHDLFETDKKWALYFIPTTKVSIYIHSNKEYFGWDFSPQLHWEANQIAEVLISMKETYTTEDAKQLSIGQRKCVFSDEIKLDYFPDEYTFTGCMKECRIKKCKKLCNCIPPFYKLPSNNLPYCTVKQLECLANYKDNITNIKDCKKCELSCSKTVYDVEKLNKDFSRSDEHSISIEYLTWPIIRYKREVLFGWVDLLVSFGGIAGLFLGFSLLSGVEILYYFTMRACCMVYKNREELYTIEEEIQKMPPPCFNMSLRFSIKSQSKNLRRRSLPVTSNITKPSQDKTHRNMTKGSNRIYPIPVSYVTKKNAIPDKVKKIPVKTIISPVMKQVKPAQPVYWNNLRRRSSDPTRFGYLP